MKHDDPQVAAALAVLAGRPEFRVLRRLEPHDEFSAAGTGDIRSVVVLDTETTGTDPANDHVIELAMLRVDFHAETGTVLRVTRAYEGLEDPGRPIPPESTAIHGITDAMVAGHRLDEDAVGEILRGTCLVIAHNAAFDRTFLEARLDIFASVPWGCSYSQLPWREAGRASAKLEFLCWAGGFFFDAHRGATDCRALLELLSLPLPGDTRPALAILLERAADKSYRLWALGSPYDTKDALRARGYRWDAERRCWHITVTRDAAKAEADWLKAHVYGGRSCAIEVESLDALTRFSSRSGPLQRRIL